MKKASDYVPTGIMMSVIGDPGKGKSTFIKSAAKFGKTAVLLSPASELDTYAGANNIVYEVIVDDQWLPTENSYRSTAWDLLMKTLKEVAADPAIKVVAIDTMSSISDVIMHKALEFEQTDNPMDIPHGKAYGAHNGMMKQLLYRLELLAHAGKHVVCAWHSDLREKEGEGVPVEATKKLDDGVKQKRFVWEERILPVMHGSMRQDVAKHFSLHMIAQVERKGINSKYSLRSVPGPADDSKSRFTLKSIKDPIKGNIGPAGFPNDFCTLLELIELPAKEGK